MNNATQDYLLRLAIDHRDALARAMVDDQPSPAWGEAAAAVRELLEYRQRAA